MQQNKVNNNIYTVSNDDEKNAFDIYFTLAKAHQIA